MSKIVLKGYIEVPLEELGVVQAELPKHKELTLNEDGCLIFEVNQDSTNMNRFNVYEEFRDKDAFNFHQQRVKSSKWGEVTKNVKRFYTINE